MLTRIFMLLMLLYAYPVQAGSKKPATPSTVHVAIEIVPDSLNTIRADLQVEVGTPARKLMNRLFQMKYADWRKAFVTGIAGFEADGRRRQFWALSINGEPSKVGIAEIVIHAPMRIRWEIKTY